MFIIGVLFLLGMIGVGFYSFSKTEPKHDPYLEFCQENGYETYSEVKIADMSWQNTCLHPDKPSKVIYRGKNGKLYLEN